MRAGRRPPRAAAATALLLVMPAALLLAGTAAARDAPGNSTILHIAHINDVHNRIEETSTTSAACGPEQREAGLCLGGWARIATAVDWARKAAKKEKAAGFLFLDVGDQFDGTLWDIVYKGQATARLQNIVKPDAMTLGNHEFSFPPKVLAEYIKKLKAPMLGACNVDASKEPELQALLKKWAVFKFGPYKVATLGWLSPDTSFLQLEAENITFNEVVPSVKKCIKELKAEHPDVDLIIGMSHTGYNYDLATAKAVPELDIILGGHSHSYLNNGNTTGPIFDMTKGANAEDCYKLGACDMPVGLFPTMITGKVCSGGAGGAKEAAGPEGAASCRIKTVPVVQAYYASKYLGHVKIDIPTKRLVSQRPMLLGGAKSSNPVPEDPSILKVIKEMAGPVAKLRDRTAGESNVTLIGGNPGRQGETNFGDYVADLFVRAGQELTDFEEKYGLVKIGILTGGNIRSDVDKGDVTYGEVLTAMPFGNTFAIKAATGAQLRSALARGISDLANNAGRFPQISGLRMWHRGTKLLGVELLNPDGSTSPLEDGKSYNVASSTYTLSGGDDYSEFAKAPYLFPSGPAMEQLMMDDLQRAAPNSIKVPDPAKERRVINCAMPYVDCANEKLFGPCCRD
ncbi:hypothetical protein Rsub_00408 [Raphidocelis subcapitata]|uniref:5'-nucleotidase n=1 Tax=Raphidocelis subcapitata TaxID=307507 RepID=A0A2V0NRZ1_9CHLO|nr:hypothetical protein Rsub_00408 [Raphidocelis subcapitata]|eukprot:GBF87697.1 hypothetical protein Rsub_00408 [Raphidocelis subcapitata]